MSITVAARTLDDLEVPAAGTWRLDPAHTTVGFIARHLMVTKVRGLFESFEGSIDIAERPEDSRVRVSIDTASVNTREPNRDAHLRSGDFFDAEEHPTMNFVSTGFTRTGTTTFELPGDLTIRGVTRPVTLEAEYHGVGLDEEGRTRAFFSARTEVDREDWGLTWNQVLEAGRVLVGRRVVIEIEVSAVPA